VTAGNCDPTATAAGAAGRDSVSTTETWGLADGGVGMGAATGDGVGVGVGVGAATNVGGCTGAGAGTTATGCTWTGTGSGNAAGTGLAGTFSWLGGNGEGVATRFGTAFVDTAALGISVGWTVGGGGVGGGAMTTS